MQQVSLSLKYQIPKPSYCDALAFRTCRLTCPLEGTDNKMRLVQMPIGSLVHTNGGDYSAKPEADDDNFRFIVELLKKSGREDRRRISCEGVASTMLEPEPGIVDWSSTDSSAAIRQGWDVFCCNGSSGPLWQLQKLDEDDRFKTDMDAWRWVWFQAVNKRCDVAQRALAFLYYRCPVEYRSIREACQSREVYS